MEEPIGVVTHYYNRISVAVVRLHQPLAVGEFVSFVGHTTNFDQRVSSMEINHQQIASAEAGAEIAILVEDRVRKGDFLLSAD
jgi:putative protease